MVEFEGVINREPALPANVVAKVRTASALGSGSLISLEVEGGAGQFTATPTADGAETFEIRYRIEGAPEYIIAVEDWPGGPFTQTGLSAGTYEVIALGVNDSGEGAPSEIATAIVT